MGFLLSKITEASLSSNDHRLLQEEAFKKSRLAYSNGDHQAAKFWSQELKRHQKLSLEKREKEQSEQFKLSNQNNNINTIDLHGLYIKEAVIALDQRLKIASRSNIKTLSVITGKGIHSDNGNARIKPAVIQFCKNNNLNYEINQRNEGLITIEVFVPLWKRILFYLFKWFE